MWCPKLISGTFWKKRERNWSLVLVPKSIVEKIHQYFYYFILMIHIASTADSSLTTSWSPLSSSSSINIVTNSCAQQRFSKSINVRNSITYHRNKQLTCDADVVILTIDFQKETKFQFFLLFLSKNICFSNMKCCTKIWLAKSSSSFFINENGVQI